MTDADLSPPRLTLIRLFARFLMFGLLAFGGPVAQIAMIRKRLIEEEGWMSGPRFNRLFAAMQVLPGPEAHELCVHLGIRARGRIGGLLAGLGFMLPGFVLMLAAAWAYVRFASGLDAAQGALLGVQVMILAVIARALQRIGMHVLEDRLLWVLAAATLVLTLVGAPFWIGLGAAGGLYALGEGRSRSVVVAAVLAVVGVAATVWITGWSPAALLPDADVAIAPTAHAPVMGALPLLWTGLKAGLLTFGGAYTAIPYVRADTVGRGWIGDGTFLDGVALAGLMPAPLVIFCTFVGYVVGGWVGALAITAGVFLPAFAFSMIFYERLERLVEDDRLHRLLAGVAAGAVGVIGATFIQLAAGASARLPGVWPALAVFAVGLVVSWRWKSRLATPVLLAAGAVAGGVIF